MQHKVLLDNNIIFDTDNEEFAAQCFSDLMTRLADFDPNKQVAELQSNGQFIRITFEKGEC